jgi:hypothetical protein
MRWLILTDLSSIAGRKREKTTRIDRLEIRGSLDLLVYFVWLRIFEDYIYDNNDSSKLECVEAFSLGSIYYYLRL